MDYNKLIKKYSIPLNEGLKSAIDSVEVMQASEMSDGTKTYKELEYLKSKLYRMYSDKYEKNSNNALDKVYILLDESVWNYEDCTRICGAFENINDAKEYLKQYVQETKDEIEFNEFEIAGNGSELDKYYLDETEDRFICYLIGEYDGYHINITIEEVKLIKEKNIESDINYGI